MDKFVKKYIRLIKKSKSNEELEKLIDSIYVCGFYDGIFIKE